MKPPDQHKYKHNAIFAMNEMPCWLDMTSDTTVDFTGAFLVPLKTTGNDKDNYTFIPSA